MPNPLDPMAYAQRGNALSVPYTAATSDDPPDYTDRYNTRLTPEQEAAFQKQMGHRFEDLRDYDLRGAWLANAQAAANGHLPDTWKKPNHPTFSDQSQYSTAQTPGGVWTPLAGGKWSFTPSPFGLSLYGRNNLQRYFSAREAGNTLVLP